MEHVLANLLLNATLHTPPGTPLLISAGVEPAGRLFIAVADEGPGLPPELRQTLFQKFQRGNAARAGGLGLGLSIVRGFMEAQGGEVVADDNPGGGARFTLFLPVALHETVPQE
jgi:two-component system sensor histidine kinase KdpD